MVDHASMEGAMLDLRGQGNGTYYTFEGLVKMYARAGLAQDVKEQYLLSMLHYTVDLCSRACQRIDSVLPKFNNNCYETIVMIKFCTILTVLLCTGNY